MASVGIVAFFALHVFLAGALVYFGGAAAAMFAALIFYPLIMLGAFMAFSAYMKLARHPDGESPSLLLALNVYAEAAFVLLLAIIVVRVSDRLFGLMLIPDYLLYGGIAGVASIFLLRGLVLVIGAFFRVDWLSQPIRLLPWKRRR